MSQDLLTVEVWSDGSGTTGDRDSGFGVVVKYPNKPPVCIGEYLGKGTNNTAELTALYRALDAIPDGYNATVYSDSQYAIGCATQPWTPKKNIELVQKLRAKYLSLQDRVTIQHVYGHSGVPENEMADQLANYGRKKVL